jgi:phenylacetate-CoA ligase
MEYQNKKVREVVRYAFENVPFYHKKFDQLGLKPEDIKSTADLNKLPIIRKDELLKNIELLISVKYNRKNLVIESTSGSTGRPLSVYLSKKEDEFRKAKLLRANMGCGQKPRDKWVVITPPPRHTSRAAKIQRLLGIYAPTNISVFDEPYTQLSRIKELNPDVLEGYSNSLLLIAKQIEKENVKISKLRMVIGEAELLDQSERQYIEKAFNVPFFDQYSSVEFDSLAWQCEEKHEYHMDSDTVHIQFVDENGEEVAPGEEGEVICTSLFNFAMPFIRYAIGDVGVLSEEQECACGRTLPLMKLVSGRKDSFILLPDGRVIPPLVIGDGMMYFKYFTHIDQYRVIQKKIDEFKILVKVKEKYTRQENFESEFANYFMNLLKIKEFNVKVEVEIVDEIPIDNTGKLRKVVSELNLSPI